MYIVQLETHEVWIDDVADMSLSAIMSDVAGIAADEGQRARLYTNDEDSRLMGVAEPDGSWALVP